MRETIVVYQITREVYWWGGGTGPADPASAEPIIGLGIDYTIWVYRPESRK